MASEAEAIARAQAAFNDWMQTTAGPADAARLPALVYYVSPEGEVEADICICLAVPRVGDVIELNGTRRVVREVVHGFRKKDGEAVFGRHLVQLMADAG